MAYDTYTSPAEPAPQEISPLEVLSARHKELSNQHKEITGQLVSVLEKDCARLERECRDMRVMLDRVRGGGPMDKPRDYT